MVEKKSGGKTADEGKACAVLAYILVGIIWYFVDEKMRKNTYAKFHVKQALILLFLSIAISIVGSVIPIIGWFIILPLGSLFTFVLWIIGIINSLSGKEKKLPIVGGLAKHLTF